MMTDGTDGTRALYSAHCLARQGMDGSVQMFYMKTDIENTWRQAISDSGLSCYRLAIDCQISSRSPSQFMAKKNTLRLDIVGKLCEWLGLELKRKGE